MLRALAWMAMGCLLSGCLQEPAGESGVTATRPTRDPGGDPGGGQPDAGKRVVYSYVDDSGRIRMADSIQDVPASFRDQVVVTDTAFSRAERLARDRILVVDLRKKGQGGPLNYSVVDLEALQRGPAPRREIRDPADLGSYVVDRAASRVRRALGLGRPAQDTRVILYTAPWCGFCKKAARHLRARGVSFVEKDIQRDRAAAVELSRKLRQAGISGGGVPVLDIGGTLVVGFDKRRIDGLLDENQ